MHTFITSCMLQVFYYSMESHTALTVQHHYPTLFQNRRRVKKLMNTENWGGFMSDWRKKGERIGWRMWTFILLSLTSTVAVQPSLKPNDNAHLQYVNERAVLRCCAKESDTKWMLFLHIKMTRRVNKEHGHWSSDLSHAKQTFYSFSQLSIG